MPGLNPKGFARPFRFGPLGHANRSNGLPRIKQNVEGTALTQKGEHFRLKTFGTVGYSLVLKNPTYPVMTLISGLVEEGVTEFEPRARVSRVSWFRRDEKDGSYLYIRLPFEVEGLEGSEIAEAKIGVS